jgi:large subunit ribosomal protein L4
MPIVDVIDSKKKKVGSVDLPDEVFGCKPHGSLVHEAVVMQRACDRQGTASTLRRGEVSGSGKKPWKQKHTGRARAGSLRSPVWRHGGTVFGPKPRSYAFGMPRKKYRAALQSVLSAKVSEGNVVVVSELSIAEAKTKLLANLLDQLGISGTALLVVADPNSHVVQAGKNLSNVTVLRPEELNVYDVLRCHSLIIPQEELGRVKEVWS